MKRRTFLQACGGVGGGALLLLTGCTRAVQQVEEVSTSEPTPEPTATAVSAATDVATEAAATPTAAEPTVTPTAEAAVDTTTTGPVSCPRGLLWDPYPGRCRKYRDTNGNGYCDWSEPA